MQRRVQRCSAGLIALTAERLVFLLQLLILNNFRSNALQHLDMVADLFSDSVRISFNTYLQFLRHIDIFVTFWWALLKNLLKTGTMQGFLLMHITSELFKADKLLTSTTLQLIFNLYNLSADRWFFFLEPHQYRIWKTCNDTDIWLFKNPYLFFNFRHRKQISLNWSFVANYESLWR